MTSKQYAPIKKAVDEFLLINKNKYDCILSFQEQLKNIDENSYQRIINFVENHKNIFFNDHQSSVLFFHIICYFASHFFQKLEIISDIALHFENELKNANNDMTENELFYI